MSSNGNFTCPPILPTGFIRNQILESEKKIREKLESLTADPAEEANKEKGMF